METPMFFNQNVAMLIFQRSTQRQIWIGNAGLIPRVGEEITLHTDKTVVKTFIVQCVEYVLDINTVHVYV